MRAWLSVSRRLLLVIFDRQPATRQSTLFLWLYALASAGGAVAYVPFLTILLPVRVAAMVGDDRVHWLAYMTFCGAVAASIGGVLFGWLSDRSHRRRPWIVVGLVSALTLLLCVPLAVDPFALLLLIVAWQLALNMMLAPLAAWAADHVPASQLGALGGLLCFAPALGAASCALVTVPGLASPDGRLVVVALLVAVCVLPALMFARAAQDPRETLPSDARTPSGGRLPVGAVAMWLARFLVQISEAALFAYLYFYFRTIDPGRDAASISRLFGLVLGLAVPVALLVGRWADRHRRPIFPLVASALGTGAGLLALAASATDGQATASYMLFGLSTTIFLSLHSAQTFRVLRRPETRGRDLGLFNLTNTAPSLIMPWLTVAIVPGFGFSGLFVLLAALAFAAGLILLAAAQRIRRA